MSFFIPAKIGSYENVIYDAVVDVGGGGDFLKISDAVDAGHKTIFFRKGTCVESGDINLTSGFSIIGESVTECIIAFSGSFGLVYDGSNGTKENSGTISVNDGFSSSNIVTGSGTNFTNLSPGDYISIRGIFYEILSIQSDTSLTLVRDHEGKSENGLTYLAQSCVVGGRLENITIAGSEKEGVYIRAANGFSMQNCLVSSCFDGVIIEESSSCYILGCMVSNNNSASANDSHGCKIVNSYYIQLATSSFSNNEGDGINISGDEFCNINVDACIISENRDRGISIESGESVVLSDCVLMGNRGIQIISSASSKKLSVSSSVCSSGGTHCIDLSGEKTLVSSCVVDYNGGVGVVCRGNEVIVIGCQISGNNLDGIGTFSAVSRLIVISNYVKDNGADGIDIGSVGTYCVVIGNIFEGNVSDGIEADGGASGYFYGNITTGNSGLNYNFSDSTKESITSEEIVIGWRVEDPTVTGTNVAGFLKIPRTHYIQEVHMSLDERGDTGSTIIDINRHDVNPSQGGQTNAVSGTTIYSTSGNRPEITGDTANATDNAFYFSPDPDIRDADTDDFLSLDIDTSTTNSSGLNVNIILKRIPS